MCPGKGHCWTINMCEAKVLCSLRDQDCRAALPREAQAPGKIRATDKR